MSDAESEFSYPRANLVVSRDGFSVEVRLPSTIRYGEAGKEMEIFAEMLVGNSPKLAIRRVDVRAWKGSESEDDLAEPERARIVENVRRAFAFKGWDLVIE